MEQTRMVYADVRCARIRLAFCFIAVYLFTLSSSRIAAEPIPASYLEDTLQPDDVPVTGVELERATEILRSAWKNAEDLRSGHFDAIVSSMALTAGSNESDKNSRKVLANLACTFDLLAEKARYEVGMEKKPYGGATLRTPNEILRWSKFGNQISRTQGPTFLLVTGTGPWSLDPRTLSWNSFEYQNRNEDNYRRFKNDLFVPSKVVRVKNINERHVELTWALSPYGLESIVFDVNNQYVPVHMIARVGRPSKDPSKVRAVQYHTDTDWLKVGGVFVPERVSTKRIMAPCSEVVAELFWNRVNQGIDQKELSLLGISVMPGAPVFEKIREKNTRTGTVNEAGVIVDN